MPHPPPPPPTSKPKPPTRTNTSATRLRSPETHQSLARRNAAVEILQSYEQLSWYALNRNESLAQTRLHFLSVLAGFTAEDEAAQVDWKTDGTPHQPGQLPRSIYTGLESLGGEGRRETSTGGKGKGKERASLSGNAGQASPGRGRASLGGESSVGGTGRKKRRSEGVGQ